MARLAPHTLGGGVAKWLRQRSAKPLFAGSSPAAASSVFRRHTPVSFSSKHQSAVSVVEPAVIPVAKPVFVPVVIVKAGNPLVCGEL